jgi:DNA-binding transcriptional MerR regulator
MEAKAKGVITAESSHDFEARSGASDAPADKAAQGQRRDDEPGFRGATVIKLVGIKPRQLDYWARTGLVTPSVRAADGSGTQRLYSFTDVVELRIIKRLLDPGVSLRQIRDAIGYLRKESGGKPLSDVTLMSDGNRIYACHSNEEVVDVLSHGTAVFGIAVGRIWADTEGDLAHLPPSVEGVEILPLEGAPSTDRSAARSPGRRA